MASPPSESIESTPSSPRGDEQQASATDSYVKLAMRNMVKKSTKSLFHFGLTTALLLSVLIGLSYLTR
ncbi:MAG: DUF3285 domain-containing protein [Cyanobacteria bacterium P01_F01_bin.42]